jgi:hypothetical protein
MTPVATSPADDVRAVCEWWVDAADRDHAPGPGNLGAEPRGVLGDSHSRDRETVRFAH